MPRQEDTLSGRSQISTPPVELVAVDRAALEHLVTLLAKCSCDFEYLSDNDVFVFATKSYLADLDTVQTKKAINLLSVWTDTWPDGSKEFVDSLNEAFTLLESVLKVAKQLT